MIAASEVEAGYRAPVADVGEQVDDGVLAVGGNLSPRPGGARKGCAGSLDTDGLCHGMVLL